MTAISVVTYNIHKGFSQFNLRLALHDIREHLHRMAPDVLMLQEVQGSHQRHAARRADWPSAAQHEFLADTAYASFAYGPNAVYPHGDHGNAILSRHPILRWENEDVSAHPFEQRGLLHCEIAIPGWDQPLHCVNVHLALFAVSRRKQFRMIRDRIRAMVPDDAPLLIGGDFNDWRGEACAILGRDLNLREAFGQNEGSPARSFPSALPFLRLDRIYVRGLQVQTTRVCSGLPWSRLSDHAPLVAMVQRGS